MSLLILKKYKFKEVFFNDNFFKSLKANDIFSCHCRYFIKYLGFKRCDKKFREKFAEFLKQENISFAISSRKLDKDIINNFINADEFVKVGLDKAISAFTKTTWRNLFNDLINEKRTDKTFEQLVQEQIETCRSIYSLELKESFQLSGGFDSGCWLILIKNKIC